MLDVSEIKSGDEPKPTGMPCWKGVLSLGPKKVGENSFSHRAESLCPHLTSSKCWSQPLWFSLCRVRLQMIGRTSYQRSHKSPLIGQTPYQRSPESPFDRVHTLSKVTRINFDRAHTLSTVARITSSRTGEFRSVQSS